MIEKLPPVPLGLIAATVLLAGCAPSKRLSFPIVAATRTTDEVHYDVDGNGVPDFALVNPGGAANLSLAYDDDEDGRFDRRYRLIDYDNESVSHLFILLDSIPYESIAAYCDQGGFAFMPPPVKVVPPFPTMSGLIFTRLLGMPPLPGMINRYYDRRRGKTTNGILGRIGGESNPWHDRLHQRPKYWENGLMFLQPRDWYPAELHRVRETLDRSGDRITLAYVASTSGLLSQHGDDGLDMALAQLEALCLQLLYERNGALKISMLSDHGHNLVPAERLDLDETIEQAGFRIRDSIRDENDVVCDRDGLVNYMGLYTRRPEALAAALVARDEVELALQLRGNEVIVQDAAGYATVSCDNGRFRYRPVTADVLGYQPLLDAFQQSGRMDPEQFVADEDWFAATIDHEWPDAPCRLWHAFHGLAVNTPDVMITYRDGYCTGLGSLDMFIDMASTHGGLDQLDSVGFAMSMTGRLRGPIRTGDLMKQLEPDYDPAARPNIDH